MADTEVGSFRDLLTSNRRDSAAPSPTLNQFDSAGQLWWRMKDLIFSVEPMADGVNEEIFVMLAEQI